jgi:endonuclease/exonuclease/phosphatase family metal-dependent hydrolase
MARTNGTVYRDYRKGKPGKKRRFSLSLLLFILDIIMSGLLLLGAAATIICVITPNTDPERLGLFSTIVLGAPMVYIVMWFTLLYWVIRWRWSMVVVTAIFVFIGSLQLGKYYRADFVQKSDAVVKNCTKVISYNIENSKDTALVNYLAEQTPSIICLQEFLSDSKNMWANLGKKYQSTVKDEIGYSCEIFTTHRILRQGTIDSLERYNAMWADIIIGERKSADTVRVINLHLKSTTITAKDKQFLEKHEYVLDSARHTKIMNIADRLSHNNVARAAQVDKVRRFIENSKPRKMIVCGDFNDVPLSFCYKQISQGFIDTFIKAGSGYRYTFDGFYNMLAIDYLFVTDHFDVISHQIDHEAKYSDHYPIISRVKIKKNN